MCIQDYEYQICGCQNADCRQLAKDCSGKFSIPFAHLIDRLGHFLPAVNFKITHCSDFAQARTTRLITTSCPNEESRQSVKDAPQCADCLRTCAGKQTGQSSAAAQLERKRLIEEHDRELANRADDSDSSDNGSLSSWEML